MYFKKLEIFGFKSFAEKTKIDFERGITAIVGPNGCGKSNIADAVNWVLGQQSAKALRGSRMEDIIFNGTELKEPLGYAEVSLTLSNEAKFLPIEYEEVTISRRLYRSGESEYLINKNPVRLKDINELLMGSGIGTSSYSLIEQGKIGQILSADPEERRIVFEEASGITKYKTKKREAIRRLESTEQNLIRVGDIVKEVERQINSIERQARKARRYQELFDRLKSLDTKLAAYHYSQMEEKLNLFRDEKGGFKTKEDTLLQSLADFNKEEEDLKSKLGNLDEKIAQYSADHQDANVSLQRGQDKVALDRERVQELHRHEAQQKEEIDSLGKRIAEMEHSIADMTNRLTDISSNTKEKEDLLAGSEEEFSALKEKIEQNEEIIKHNKLNLMDVIALQSKLRNEITKIASDMQNVSARLRRLNVERDNVSKEATMLESNLSETRLSVNMTISKVETLEQERISFQNSVRNERGVFTLLEKRISDSKNNVLSLHSKVDFLRDLVERHEGFSGGAQALLNSLSDGKLTIEGFCEPLAELLEPRRGYEAACEAALMGNLQTIVVENWNTAFAALDFLKKNNLGKASFINSTADDPNIRMDSLNHRSISGNIIDFMNFDPRYEPLFASLLRNTFLVNTIDDGLSALKDLPEGLRRQIRLITTKGDIVTKYIITGGSHSQDFTSSLIGRQTRIKETEERIAELEKEILKLKQESNIKRELIEDFQAKIRKVEEMVRSEEIELAQKRSHETNLEKERKKIQEEADLVSLEIEESLARHNELKYKEAEFKSQLDNAAKNESELQDHIINAQNFIKQGSKKREDLLVTITQVQTELSSLRREEDEYIKEAQTEKSYYEEQLQISSNKREFLEQSYRRQKELKEEIERLLVDIERLKERHGIISKELDILKEERAQLKDFVEKREEELNKKREDINFVKDKTHNLQMEEAQLSFQMEALKNKIDQVYKLDVREIIPDPEDIGNPQAIQKEVDHLRQTTEKMGPVNLVAIDEHKELQERFSFLKHQREDLISARESLLKAIKKISQTTKNLFMDTFASIQAEFKNYFRFLFGGGKAEIILLDERDVLESGIEIIVRPPGKKLQTISLLSGGEKALTAIALLFAIFKIKPSPFCLLDEIDAPLDESNIGRFSKALQEFAKKSQFIIITHNKKTIGISDIMYGITMEQSGVSKIISVKFAKKSQKEEEPVLA